MQDAPDAARLLAAMADTLERRVLPALGGSAQHQARVVANLCRVLARQHELDPVLDADARAALMALPGVAGGHDAVGNEPGGLDAGIDTIELWHRCAQLVDGLGDSDADDRLAATVHAVVSEIVVGKVRVAKPDYLRPGDQPSGGAPVGSVGAGDG